MSIILESSGMTIDEDSCPLGYDAVLIGGSFKQQELVTSILGIVQGSILGLP
jgi:hypothetical protein